jgi:hypothetical protein
MKSEEPTQRSSKNTYTYEDAMKVVDDIFKLSKEKNYHPGAFVHGLVFALEATQQTYQIPAKQIAEVKRNARRYLQELEQVIAQEKKQKPDQ